MRPCIRSHSPNRRDILDVLFVVNLYYLCYDSSNYIHQDTIDSNLGHSDRIRVQIQGQIRVQICHHLWVPPLH